MRCSPDCLLDSEGCSLCTDQDGDGRGSDCALGDDCDDDDPSRWTTCAAGVWQDISAEGLQTCALRNSAIWCWGSLADGSLPPEDMVPRLVEGLTNASQIVAGSTYSCALLEDSTARCWGSNYNLQLVSGTTEDSSSPLPIVDTTGVIDDVLDLDTGAMTHTCIIRFDRTVWCGGSNSSGWLGTGTTSDSSFMQPVINVPDVLAISAGWYHTCAVLGDGTARCWGNRGGGGMLGDGGVGLVQPTPVRVVDLTGLIDISAGETHTCALRNDGTVWCWGGNHSGQVGDRSTEDRPTPVAVTDLTDAVAITTGKYHSCALRSDQTAWCWGGNPFGQLGDGSTVERPHAAPVPGLAGVIRISAGLGHSCALLDDGSAWCWGYNLFGQLGDSTDTNRSTPVRVLEP